VYISRYAINSQTVSPSSDYHGSDNSFSYILQSYRFHKNRNETPKRSDGTSEKVAIDANTNIPEVIQEFSGQFKSEKMTLNLSIMVCLIYFL
jgi:hypothetical protein